MAPARMRRGRAALTVPPPGECRRERAPGGHAIALTVSHPTHATDLWNAEDVTLECPAMGAKKDGPRVPGGSLTSLVGLAACAAILVGYFLPWTGHSPAFEDGLEMSKTDFAR